MNDMREALKQAAIVPDKPLDHDEVAARMARLQRRPRQAMAVIGLALTLVAVVPALSLNRQQEPVTLQQGPEPTVVDGLPVDDILPIDGDATEPTAADGVDAGLSPPDAIEGETVPGDAIEAEPTAPVRLSWQQLPPPPLSRRYREAIVWTGSALLVFGGGEPGLADGAVYDLRTGSWTPMEPAPVGISNADDAVWTGTEAVVWEDGVGLAYDPAINSWRQLPEAPLARRTPLALAFSGTEVFVVGDVSRSGPNEDAAAYDVHANAWRALPDLPQGVNVGSLVPVEGGVIAIGSTLDGNNFGDPVSAYAYDANSDRWRGVAGPDLAPQSLWAESVNGQLVAFDYNLATQIRRGVVDSWVPGPPIPLDNMECAIRGAASDRYVLALYCQQAALYDTVTGAWQVANPPVDVDVAAWDGSRFIGCGYTDPRPGAGTVPLACYSLDPGVAGQSEPSSADRES